MDDDGLHEEMFGGRMLPENKQALDRLYDAKQTQAVHGPCPTGP